MTVEVIYNVENYKNKSENDETINKTSERCGCLNYKKDKKGNYIYNEETIEFDRCNKKVVKNGFCASHQKCFDFMKLFTNGYEPEFTPTKWNDNAFVNGSHNCYAYFLDAPNKSLMVKCQELCKNNEKCPNEKGCRNLMPQPGHGNLMKLSGSTKKSSNNYTCENMIKRISSDTKTLHRTNLTKKCPINTYKGAMVVDPGKTFHFYRLNDDGSWSHKPGVTHVRDTDASGKKIVVPHFTDRNYKRNKNNSSKINYTDFCGYFCIPKNTEATKLLV